jgi:hypothetical protein
MRKGTLLLLLVAVTVVSSQAADDLQKNEEKASAATAATSPNSDLVLVGAGDIASCDDLSGAYATAKLIEKIPGTVFAAGDLAYPAGTDEQFANCYGPTWGRFKDRTRPAPGNHEYNSAGASGYVRYFGEAAGDPKKGYYGYDLGQWHIIVLNSECADVGGCDAASEQGKWLQKDLVDHRAGCTLAYFHKPLFSSGLAHGNDLEMKFLWDTLYHAGADVVINGHDPTTNALRPRTRRERLIPSTGFGSSWWEVVARIHTVFSRPPGVIVKFEMRTRSGC